MKPRCCLKLLVTVAFAVCAAPVVFAAGSSVVKTEPEDALNESRATDLVTPVKALDLPGEAFRWKDPVSGNWDDTNHWSTFVVPLGDGTETITVPASNNIYDISVNVDNVAIRGLTIESLYSTAGTGTQAIRFKTKELAIGEGGFHFSDAGQGYAAPSFSDLLLTTSQTWNVDYQNGIYQQRIYFVGKVTAAEDVVWTMANCKLNRTFSYDALR